MEQIPTLTTERLTLRPFTLADVSRVTELAGDWEVAKTTATIPHPYKESVAEQWIMTHQKTFEIREAVTFAIVLKEEKNLIGAIGLHIKSEQVGEIGYWIGKPYWNRGFATEAAKAVVAYGFEKLKLSSIQAHHMTKNPASGQVMQKIGMKHTDHMKQKLCREGMLEDIDSYTILREEWTKISL